MATNQPKVPDLTPPKVKPPSNKKRKIQPLPQVRKGHTNKRPELPQGHTKPRPLAREPREPRYQTTKRKPIPRPSQRPAPKLTRTGPKRQNGSHKKRRPAGISPRTRRIINLAIVLVVLAGIGTFVLTRVLAGNAMAVSVGGQHFGYMVLNRETTSESFTAEVLAHMEATHLASINLQQSITVTPARWVRSGNINRERNSMISQVGGAIGFTLNAHAIYINNRLEVVLASQDCINQLEELLVGEWVSDSTIEHRFVNPWEIIVMEVPQDYEYIVTPWEAANTLDRMEMVYSIYHVQPGDNFGSIALMFDTIPDNIAATNNMSLDTILQPGDRLTVRTPMPLLSVVTVDEIVNYEEIPMPIEVVQTNELAIATSNVIQEGAPGENRIIQHITRVNGVTTMTETLEAELVREPIPRIVEEGTRPSVIERR